MPTASAHTVCRPPHRSPAVPRSGPGRRLLSAGLDELVVLHGHLAGQGLAAVGSRAVGVDDVSCGKRWGSKPGAGVPHTSPLAPTAMLHRAQSRGTRGVETPWMSLMLSGLRATLFWAKNEFLGAWLLDPGETREGISKGCGCSRCPRVEPYPVCHAQCHPTSPWPSRGHVPATPGARGCP